MRPVLITFILSLLNLGRGVQRFHSLLLSAPSPAPMFIWVSSLHGPQPGSDPAEGTAGWGAARGARGARAGAHPAPAPLPAAGTASDAPRHKGALSADSVQLTDKTTTTTKGTYG